ncbi:MAG: hypothetical protein EOO68_00560 [Moraxellaceae bacterium]|nr:MAG: hypothetical protein EOO68_00560 [Moraxellaceae bacterium]
MPKMMPANGINKKYEPTDMKILRFWLYFLFEKCAFGLTTIIVSIMMHFITPLIAEPKDELRNFGLMVGFAIFKVQLSWELISYLIQQRVRFKARAQRAADTNGKTIAATHNPDT